MRFSKASSLRCWPNSALDQSSTDLQYWPQARWRLWSIRLWPVITSACSLMIMWFEKAIFLRTRARLDPNSTVEAKSASINGWYKDVTSRSRTDCGLRDTLKEAEAFRLYPLSAEIRTARSHSRAFRFFAPARNCCSSGVVFLWNALPPTEAKSPDG